MVWNNELKCDIPKDWRATELGTISRIVTSSVVPRTSTMYHHYSIPAFDETHMPICEKGSCIDSNKYLVNDDCILVSKLNPQFKRIWMVSKAPEDSICSTEFMPFVSTNQTVEFLYSTLNSDAFYTFMVNNSSSSTGSRKRMSPELCPLFKMAYPANDDLINRFCAIVKPLLRNMLAISNENSKLVNLRDYLLPVLMNGQATVLD